MSAAKTVEDNVLKDVLKPGDVVRVRAGMWHSNAAPYDGVTLHIETEHGTIELDMSPEDYGYFVAGREVKPVVKFAVLVPRPVRGPFAKGR